MSVSKTNSLKELKRNRPWHYVAENPEANKWFYFTHLFQLCAVTDGLFWNISYVTLIYLEKNCWNCIDFVENLKQIPYTFHLIDKTFHLSRPIHFLCGVSSLSLSLSASLSIFSCRCRSRDSSPLLLLIKNYKL